jgi:AAA+ superfamily predicted ATPase
VTVLSLREQAARINLIRRPSASKLKPSVFVARGLVVRALRHAGLHHVLRREPCTFGLVGVEVGSVDAVSSAVREIMKAPLTANLGYDVTVYDKTDSRRKTKASIESVVLEAARGDERACVLFSGRGAVSVSFLASAEGVVDMPKLDARILRGAFMETVGRSPGWDGLAVIATLPIDLLDSVVVAGRSVERSLRVARKLLAAVATAEAKTDEDDEPLVEVASDGPRLEDLSGLGDAGRWGKDLATDLADYRKGLLPWADVDKGVLVAGPPGVGKTMFAQALGRTCGVPVHLHSCATWQAKGHLGDLLKAMVRAFKEAKQAAPCILFLDEMDSFGSRDDPGDRYSAYSRQVIDGLLEQLDGAQGREGVVVVGATNRPALIDDAILRPGRLDRVIMMSHPDAAARVGILRHHLRGSLADIDLGPLSERMEGATGADIELLVRDARRLARRRRESLTVADLERGIPPEMRQSDELFHRVCIHEAAHLVVGLKLADESGSDAIEAKVDRGCVDGSAGTTEFRRRPGFDRTRASFLAEVTVLLAGSAAEEEIIGVRGDGSGGTAGSDLAHATAIVAAVETSFGLGEGLLHLAGTPEEAVAALGRDPALRARVRGILDECFARARGIVAAEREVVDRVAAVLAVEGRSGAEPSRLERVMEGKL